MKTQTYILGFMLFTALFAVVLAFPSASPLSITAGVMPQEAEAWFDAGCDDCHTGGSFTFPPTCMISAQPFTITRGESATLKWSTFNASSANINQGVGGVSVGTNKSFVVSPTETTKYTMTVTAGDKQSTCVTEVTVTEPPVMRTCEITASASQVPSGGSVTLSWKTTGFDTITINGQTVSGTSGSQTFSDISQDTTFNLVAKTADGNHDCHASVKVLCIPPPVAPTCSSLGYGPAVAKFNWNGSQYVAEYMNSGFNISLTGSAATAAWTSNYPVDGVIVKAATQYKVFAGGLSGTLLKSAIGAGQYDISNAVFCGKKPPVTPDPVCELTPVHTTIKKGGSVNLVWSTQNASQVTLQPSFGTVALSGSVNTGSLQQNTTYTLVAQNNAGKKAICTSSIKVETDEPVPPSCPLTAKDGRTIINFDGSRIRSDQTESKSRTGVVNTAIPAGEYKVTLVGWDGYVGRQNVTQPNERYVLSFLNGGVVALTSQALTDIPDKVIEATQITLVNESLIVPTGITGLRADHAVYPDTSSANSLNPICAALDVVPPTPVPSCDSFGASPTTIKQGDTATLSWTTSNATKVVINNGIGEVVANGSKTVSPLETVEYVLTVFGADNSKKYCKTTVTVEHDEPAPVCESFTVSPAILPFGGGNTTLTWVTRDAATVSINQGIGVVAATGTRVAGVTDTTTFTLTATNSAGESVQCPAKVIVEPPVPTVITCADNVAFSANPSSIRRGAATTLSWSTTGITSVSFDQGITATGLSGSVQVSPRTNTTYTMTVSDGTTTVQCPVPVRVTTGGGGGTVLPLCTLRVSDRTITAGDRVTLTWTSRNATEVQLQDEDGTILVESDDNDDFNGSIQVRPTEDTTYTFTASRGARDRVCEVDIDVRGPGVVVVEQRDQQPLVAGIALSQVPYTGFEAGPLLTFMFYALLLGWSLYLAYVIAVKRNGWGDAVVATGDLPSPVSPAAYASTTTEPQHIGAYTQPQFVKTTTPANLPTGDVTVGYQNHVEPIVPTLPGMDAEVVAAIENRAHQSHVLLSSDAMRYFLTTTEGMDRMSVLDGVLTHVVAQYPTEDGWVVLNAERMTGACEACLATPQAVASEVPVGAGSLAEAIVTGNIVAAYQMIGHRPMIALADAAADLDAAYRAKHGEVVHISALLATETAKFEEATLHAAIQALTGALDGTYDTEEEAVKMAIMKAVKALA